MTKKMNRDRWNEVDEEKCQEDYEKNQEVDSRNGVLHAEKSDL